MEVTYRVYRTEICASLDSVPKKAIIDYVNGKEVEGICVTCGQVILTTDSFDYDVSDGEDIIWHSNCEEAKINEER